MTTDSTDPSTERRPRGWRLFATTCILVVVLGAGWVAGVKTQETTDLAQLSSAAWAKLDELGSLVETPGRRLLSTLQGQATGQQTTPESSRTTERASFDAGEIEGLSLKLDQCRASSEAAVEDLRGTLNRVLSLLESNQRELGAEFEALRARLDRGDRNEPTVTGPMLTKLHELNERLDRIERSTAAAALSKAQPAVANGSVPGTTAPALAPDLVTASASKSEDKPQTAETKKILNWTVREVIDGTAILQGPRGVIGVSTGDVVPGVGRVQSIAKRGGRWIVATNKGVISAP